MTANGPLAHLSKQGVFSALGVPAVLEGGQFSARHQVIAISANEGAGCATAGGAGYKCPVRWRWVLVRYLHARVNRQAATL
jgi:hypothetical protein